MKKLYNKLKKRYEAFQIHPLTNKNSLQALFRYIMFNVSQNLFPKTRVFKWINGLKFYAKKGDAGIVGNIYFKLFDYEDSMFLIHNLRENDLFIDVGANLGHYSMLAAGICKAQVMSFEPIIETFQKLEANVKLNKLEHLVQLFNIGVGDKKGSLQFTRSFDVMNRVAFGNELNLASVKVETLNDLLEFSNPAFLKIDVEGYEYFVLKGAEKILKNQSLKYIIIELNNSSEKFGNSDDSIHQLLLGFDFVPIRYFPENKKIEIIPTYNTRKFNTIYVRNGLEVYSK